MAWRNYFTRCAPVMALGRIWLMLIATGASALAWAAGSDCPIESGAGTFASAAASGDLQLSIQRVAPVGQVGEGQSPTAEYLIEVLNQGSTDRFGIELQVHPEDGLIAPAWGCAVPDAACDPSIGEGDVLAHFDLPAGVRASVNLYAQVNPGARYVGLEAQVLQPSAPVPLLDQAHLVDPIRTGSVFRGGFESYAQ